MTRTSGILVTGALAASLLPAGLFAQSYGLGSQVLSIGASAFRAENGHGVIGSDGYLYNANPNDPAGGRGYDAPLSLPDGAEITGMCIYFRNDGPSADLGVSVYLDAANLVPGGLAPGFHVLGGLDSYSNDGYSEFCSSLPFYTFHETADIDNDGIPEHLGHRVHAFIYAGANIALGGVRISWQRQISPPPATASFGDVPTDDIFFPFVEALASSGITAGCGGGNFCRDAPLTRAQMAAFLAKALGLHWAD